MVAACSAIVQGDNAPARAISFHARLRGRAGAALHIAHRLAHAKTSEGDLQGAYSCSQVMRRRRLCLGALIALLVALMAYYGIH